MYATDEHSIASTLTIALPVTISALARLSLSCKCQHGLDPLTLVPRFLHRCHRHSPQGLRVRSRSRVPGVAGCGLVADGRRGGYSPHAAARNATLEPGNAAPNNAPLAPFVVVVVVVVVAPAAGGSRSGMYILQRRAPNVVLANVATNRYEHATTTPARRCRCGRPPKCRRAILHKELLQDAPR
ncbi:hypothetical protein GGR56DRAFT_414259 [Xylariaceae sp. FL0804]|nr:hypothetical protein GGR56DRAFT_414259 [Xylariaceae sp. FL0804]